MTMRERVARAICRKHADHIGGVCDETRPIDPRFYELVDSALDALMEPTEVMMEAAVNAYSAQPVMTKSIADWWRAGVSAVKEERDLAAQTNHMWEQIDA